MSATELTCVLRKFCPIEQLLLCVCFLAGWIEEKVLQSRALGSMEKPFVPTAHLVFLFPSWLLQDGSYKFWLKSFCSFDIVSFSDFIYCSVWA